MEYIKRHIEELVLKLSGAYSAILITGPRQTGKTTMLRRLAEKENKGRRYVTLDDLNVRELAKNDPAMFLELNKPPIIIDEVQYAPELLTYIKIHIDKFQKAGEFWMTGSQIFGLMKGIGESLAGRVALLRMSPLSQREIVGLENEPFTTDINRLLSERERIEPITTPELFERIFSGGMPGFVSGRFQNRDIFYSSYVSTYIERDVRELVGSIDALKFNRFITAVAARTSQLLNYNALAEDADTNIATAKSWINLLEALGIIFLLHPYSNNVQKRTIKTPKIYFYDTGLVCYLTKWSSPIVAESGAMSGALVENFAVSEIMKSYQNAGLEPYLYFYRDRDTKEIDVIIEGDGKLCPIEIKKTASPEGRLIRNFAAIDKSPLKLGTGAVLCMSQLGAINKDNLIIPIWMI